MGQAALFIRHKALPGKRDEVRRVWEKHLMPIIKNNPAHLAYFYCYDDQDPDRISVFQRYADAGSPEDFMQAPGYAAYIEEVTPLLAAEPEIGAASVVWAKT